MKLATILNKFGKLRGAVQALATLSRTFGDTARSLGKVAGRNGQQMLKQVQGTADGWTSALKNARPDNVGNLVGKVDDGLAKISADGFADTLSPANIGRVSAYEATKEGTNADENCAKAVQEADKNGQAAAGR
jgi:hypothetical protein